MLPIEQEVRDKMHKFIDEQCIFRCKPDVQYFSNMKKGSLIPSGYSPEMKWCFYLRRFTHNPELLMAYSYNVARDIIASAAEGKEYTNIQLCGLETGSLPILAGVQMAFMAAGISVNAFSIRKERKRYGLCHYIDGHPNMHPYIILDDLISSGGTSRKIIEICRYELNLEPARSAYFIVKRDDREYYNFDNDTNIKVKSVFTYNDFNFEYDESKYWLPLDCTNDMKKRPS